MSRVRTVAICYPQVPFFRGGAELLAESLGEALRARGFEADLVSLPFRWYPKPAIALHCLAWRLLDLSESNGKAIDLVIATKFPSYAVKHERKVTWLVHQLRQAYDLHGTPFGDFANRGDELAVRELVRRIDGRTLPESRRLFAISKTVARRVREFNGLEAVTLYPPPRAPERFHGGRFERYVLSVGRLEATKRVAALIEALPHTDPELRCVIVGSGPEEKPLRARVEALGIENRVVFRPSVSLRELVRLYSRCLAVYYAPFQEDYGYVTVEAFLSRKPVVTAPDAGGPLEFVSDGVSGVVVELEPEKLAERLRFLDEHPERARELGRTGYERVRGITWDSVIDALLSLP